MDDKQDPRNRTGLRFFFFLLGLFVIFASIMSLNSHTKAGTFWGWLGLVSAVADLWMSNPLKTNH